MLTKFIRRTKAMYIILIIAALIFSVVASIKVKTTYAKYDGITVRCGMTSNECARRVMTEGGVSDVAISAVSGSLTDNYNPKTRTLSLSDSTRGKTTVGAIGVAAHEAGHAVQHSQGYSFLALRAAMVPVVNIGSNIGIILCIIGMLLGLAGSFLTGAGIALYSLTFLFTLITLPVEFNASRRAITAIKGMGCFDESEIKGMEQVLKAAAMTYVASMASALANLLRIIAIFGGRNRRR